ncbi:MAG: Os1348 family NHLP clan protein [Anaerolineales bacterium]|jgi:hypothetical protein
MIEQEGHELNFLPYLAGRAFLDPTFREQFLNNPGYAARQLGLHLTESQIEHLKALDPAEVEGWVDQFEGFAGQPIMAMSAW